MGNVPSTDAFFYSIAGVLALLVVLALFVYWVHRYGLWYGSAKGVALSEKLIDMPLTRSADFFEKGSVVLMGTLRVIPDVIIIVLGVLPLAYFLITTYPHLKAAEIRDDESVWERLGIEL